jgi:hypothetical protein
MDPQLWNLPIQRPAGAADPMFWPLFSSATTAPAAAAPSWLSQNSTAVVAIAGALFVLALFGGRRGR